MYGLSNRKLEGGWFKLQCTAGSYQVYLSDLLKLHFSDSVNFISQSWMDGSCSVQCGMVTIFAPLQKPDGWKEE